MKSWLLAIFLMCGVHSLEEPLEGEGEGVRVLISMINIIIIILIVIIIMINMVSIMEYIPRKTDIRNMT